MHGNIKKRGFVSLVGAGCAKGFISLKGLECIKQADVILYDDLIDDELLKIRKDDCELIYVGKRSGKHYKQQEEINELLIKKAEMGKYVVRLKGGDPFVFGRGGEEVLALSEKNISYELVPGVTSAVAVPELLGIPVTHREVAREFTVITGHTSSEKNNDYRKYASYSGTLVFLMALQNAGKIASELMEGGMSGDMSAAIVSYGVGTFNYRTDCTVKTLEESAAAATTPAIIIVGNVCRFHMSDESRKSAAVIGTKEFADKCTAALMPLGLKIIPNIVFEKRELPENIPASFDNASLLVFTSARGVESFFKGYAGDIRSLATVKFACIGAATKEALWEHGIIADICPNVYTSKALREGILREYDGEKIYLLRSAKGNEELYVKLTAAGKNVSDLAIYDMETVPTKLNCKVDFYVFGSAGGVDVFFEEAHPTLEGRMIAIGPVTAGRLQEYVPDKDRVIMAEEASVEGIQECMCELLRENDR